MTACNTVVMLVSEFSPSRENPRAPLPSQEMVLRRGSRESRATLGADFSPGGLSRWQMGQHLLRSGGRDTHNGLSLFWAIRPGLGQQRRLCTGKRLITMEETRSFSVGSEAREHQ